MYPSKKQGFRVPYDRERDEAEGAAAGTSFVGQESLTQQSFTKDCDINEIVRRCGVLDDELPPPPSDPRYYGDFTRVPDLREVLELGREAKDRFMALPAKVRAKFDNEPAKLWSWIQDPENHDQAVKLGLLARHTPKPPPPGDSPPAPPAGS